MRNAFLCQLNESSVRSKLAEAIDQLRAAGMIPEGIKSIERFDIPTGSGQPEYQCAITHKWMDDMDFKEAVPVAGEVIN